METTNTYLSPLFIGEEIIVSPARKHKALTIARAPHVFHYIDRSFDFWDGLGIVGDEVVPTYASVHEVIRNGNFQDFFGNPDPEWGWWESQVVSFCDKHPHRLHHQRHATLFPLKGGFLARVDFDAHRRLGAYAYRLVNERTWHAKVHPWVVIPGRPTSKKRPKVSLFS